MTNFNTLPRSIAAALGALVISTAFIAAAVAPAATTGHSAQVASIAIPTAQANA
jgi:hypothetical protein